MRLLIMNTEMIPASLETHSIYFLGFSVILMDKVVDHYKTEEKSYMD